MKYYAEKLGKYYDSVEDCEAAEKEYEEKLAAKKKQKEEKSKERKLRANEVQDAFTAYKEAEKTYYKLRNAFIKDYGYYHATYSSTDETPNLDIKTLVDELFDFGRLI